MQVIADVIENGIVGEPFTGCDFTMNFACRGGEINAKASIVDRFDVCGTKARQVGNDCAATGELELRKGVTLF